MELHVLGKKWECNGCTVCCTVMAVRELGKPFYTPCRHKGEAGCGIYSSRPQPCREYFCAWAAGVMGDATSQRPDQNGLLFGFRRYDDGLWLEVHEAARGAAGDLRLVETLAQRIVAEVGKTEKVVGMRIHRFGDAIGLAFDADAAQYPGAVAVSRKMNRYAWVNGDPRRQMFIEAHDP